MSEKLVDIKIKTTLDKSSFDEVKKQVNEGLNTGVKGGKGGSINTDSIVKGLEVLQTKVDAVQQTVGALIEGYLVSAIDEMNSHLKYLKHLEVFSQKADVFLRKEHLIDAFDKLSDQIKDIDDRVEKLELRPRLDRIQKSLDLMARDVKNLYQKLVELEVNMLATLDNWMKNAFPSGLLTLLPSLLTALNGLEVLMIYIANTLSSLLVLVGQRLPLPRSDIVPIQQSQGQNLDSGEIGTVLKQEFAYLYAKLEYSKNSAFQKMSEFADKNSYKVEIGSVEKTTTRISNAIDRTNIILQDNLRGAIEKLGGRALTILESKGSATQDERAIGLMNLVYASLLSLRDSLSRIEVSLGTAVPKFELLNNITNRLDVIQNTLKSSHSGDVEKAVHKLENSTVRALSIFHNNFKIGIDRLAELLSKYAKNILHKMGGVALSILQRMDTTGTTIVTVLNNMGQLLSSAGGETKSAKAQVIEPARTGTHGGGASFDYIQGYGEINEEMVKRMAQMEKGIREGVNTIAQNGTKYALDEARKAGETITRSIKWVSDDAINGIGKNIKDQVPQSPIKRGPLVFLNTLGEKFRTFINDQFEVFKKKPMGTQIFYAFKFVGSILYGIIKRIAKGIEWGLSKIAGVVKIWLGTLLALLTVKLFKIIIFLPLRLLGKLRGLVTTILKSIKNMVINWTIKLAQSIYKGMKDTLDKAREVLKASVFQRQSFDGVSVLASLFKQFNVEVTEASAVTRSLHQALTNMGRARELDGLGFNFKAIRESGDRFKETLLQVSDILKDSNTTLEDQQKLLSYLGVAGQTNLLLMFRKSREELSRMYDLMTSPALRMTEAAGNIASIKMEITGLLDSVKQALFSRILGPLEGQIKKIKDGLENFIAENGLTIAALATLLGEVISEIFDSLDSIMSFIIDEPKQAWDLLITNIAITTKMLMDQIKIWADVLVDDVLTLTYRVSWEIIGKLFSYIFSKLSSMWSEHVWVPARKFVDDLVVDALAETLIFFDQVWTKAKTFFSKAGDYITKWFNNLIDSAMPQWLLDYLDVKPEQSSAKPEQSKVELDEVDKKLADLKKKFNEGLIDEFELSEAISRVLEEPDLDFNPYEGLTAASNDFKGTVSETILAVNEIVNDTVQHVEEKSENITSVFEGLFSQEKIQGGIEGSRAAIKSFLDDVKAEVSKVAGAGSGESGETTGDNVIGSINKVFSALSPERLRARLAELKAVLSQEVPKLVDAQPFESFFGKIEKWLDEFGQSYSSAFGQMGQAFGDLYEMSGKKIKEFAIAQKAFNIAMAIMNVAMGVTKALGLGPWGVPLAGMIVAAGAVQIAKIAATPIPMASGGLVTGGSGSKDDVPIMGMGGEFMLRKEAVQKYGLGFIESLNNLETPQFMKGGLVPTAGPVASAGSGPKQEINIINFQDKSQLESYMASREASSIVMNHLASNRTLLKSLVT